MRVLTRTLSAVSLVSAGYVEGLGDVCGDGELLSDASFQRAGHASAEKQFDYTWACMPWRTWAFIMKGWSRMDTVAFFSNYGITDTDTVERIYELIIGSPGNYLKYYIGYVEFLELKKDWLEREGGCVFPRRNSMRPC